MAKKKKKNKNKVSGTSVSNPAVKSAMQALKEGSTPEKQNALTLALYKAKLLAPGKVEPQADGAMNINLLILNTNDGHSYFPLFTDQMEANKAPHFGHEDVNYIIRQIKDYQQIFEDPANTAEGIVINPGEESVIVNRETIQSIASGNLPLMQVAQKASSGPTRYVEPAVYPTKMVNAIYDACVDIKEISRVWLKEKQTPGNSWMAFFVEADTKDRKILAKLNEVGSQFAQEDGIEIDFITDKIMKEVIVDAVALYDRELEL